MGRVAHDSPEVFREVIKTGSKYVLLSNINDEIFFFFE